MTTFGTRLKIERKRINKTQTELGAVVGLEKNTQSLYERDVNSPPASYLEQIAKVGVDIHFLFYGVYSDTAASQQFSDLIAVLHKLTQEQQAIGFGMLSMLAANDGGGGTNLLRADALWRAARLYNQFLMLTEAERQMVEGAVAAMQIPPPPV